MATDALVAFDGEDPELAVLGHEHDPAGVAVGDGLDDDAGALARGLADPEHDLPIPDGVDAEHRRAGAPIGKPVRLQKPA